jgi:hypothetical protein
LFVTAKNDKVLKSYGIVLNKEQRGLLAKIHNSASIKTGAGQKLVLNLQAKLMKDIILHVQRRVEQERLESRMEAERKDWDAEQDEIRTQELRVKMAKFLLERQQENDVLNYVIEKEANESDEDFNVFDQLAQEVGEERVGQKLREDFSKKLEGEKSRIVTDKKEEKIDYHIDPDKLEETLKKHSDQPPARL